SVIVNGNSQLIGGLAADRLTINGSGLLWLASATSGNHAPLANGGTLQLNEDTAASVVLVATDPDGDTLGFTIVAAPAHGVLSGVAPNLTYTPAPDFNGSDSFTFKANDGQSDSNVAAVAITVLPVNDRPVADSRPLVLAEDTAASVILSGSDVDGDALTFSVVNGPGHGALSGTAPNLTYTPAANYNGPDAFTYVASDGSLTSAAATVSITVTPVNDAPVAIDRSYSVSEGSTVAITLTGSDVDGDALTFQRLTSPSNGSLTGTAPNFVYRPNANFNGVDSFTFTASDGQATSAPGTIAINVTNLNFAPVANSAAAQTNEDVPVVVTLTASDQDGDPLAFSIVAPPQHGTLGSVASTGNGTATVNYTPAENYNGLDSFTFKARDTASADSNVATISLTIHSVNDAPTADSRSVQTDEDVPLAIQLTGSDIEQSALTYVVVTQPQHGALSGAAPNVTYTPAADYNRPDSFTFKVNDGQLDSTAATISIDVRPVNDAPVAAAQAATTNEDASLTLTLTATDVENSALTFAIVTPPQHGTVGSITAVSANSASVVYTPAPDYNGADSFTFKANDGGKDSEPASLTLTIVPQNDAPVATGQDLVQPQDTPFDFTLSATDVDGDALSYTIVRPPAHGALSGTAPNLTFTPDFNYRGSDSLVFKANDGQVDSNEATIAFTMTPVSHPPVASSGSPVTLDEDASATIVLPASDLDGDALSYFIVAPPQHGTLGPVTIANGVATVTYTPTANYNGADSFTFKASDGAADSNEASIAITIRAVNDAPVASAQTVATDEDTPVAFALTATDVDGDALSYVVVAPPAHGTLSGTAPNLTYTPAADYNGPDSFTFKVIDPVAAESNVATVSLAVAPVNDAPVAANKSVTTDEDTSVAIVLTATDVDSASLTFAVVTPPQHGTLSGLAPNLVYQPAADFNGSDTFTYKANDGALDSAPATVSIAIAPVNDAPIANPLTISTSSGAPTAIVLTGSDVDNATLNFAIISQPQLGTLAGTPPNLTYTSNASFGGFDSFTFAANDGQLGSAPATIQIIAGLPPRSRTYTTTADFAGGTLASISTDVPDQISNRTVLASYDVVWVANSTKGTVVKLDAETGRALGEYLTTPAGVASPYPSRVAIDSKGSVWVANYSHNSIVKIGQPDNGSWVDRNHDGVATTSTGLGDIKPWTGTNVSGAADEAILLYVPTDITGGVRHISVDADDNVWVGGTSGVWEKYDGRTGALLRTELGNVGGGMGGFIGSDGKLYSAGSQFLIWNTSGPLASQPAAANIRPNTWAEALDSHGNLWCTRDGSSTVTKYSPSGQLLGEYYHGEPWGMGIAIDASDHVWIAHSHCGHSVGHLLPDGTWVGNVEVANHGPVNVSIDRHGRIWVTSSTGV
ncbi:MAG TPA: Ig-like domain-containing protein, partial [Vicinamibacterales bacterium]|nr:Ig-like domain-containing protein [Vicinamibacterales bacterium]